MQKKKAVYMILSIQPHNLITYICTYTYQLREFCFNIIYIIIINLIYIPGEHLLDRYSNQFFLFYNGR